MIVFLAGLARKYQYNDIYHDSIMIFSSEKNFDIFKISTFVIIIYLLFFKFMHI